MSSLFAPGDKVFLIPGRGGDPLSYGQVYTIRHTEARGNTGFVELAECPPGNCYWQWRFIAVPDDLECMPEYVRMIFAQNHPYPTVPCYDIAPENIRKPAQRSLRGVRVRDI